MVRSARRVTWTCPSFDLPGDQAQRRKFFALPLPIALLNFPMTFEAVAGGAGALWPAAAVAIVPFVFHV
jgi:hypothetical protein